MHGGMILTRRHCIWWALVSRYWPAPVGIFAAASNPACISLQILLTLRLAVPYTA